MLDRFYLCVFKIYIAIGIMFGFLNIGRGIQSAVSPKRSKSDGQRRHSGNEQNLKRSCSMYLSSWLLCQVYGQWGGYDSRTFLAQGNVCGGIGVWWNVNGGWGGNDSRTLSSRHGIWVNREGGSYIARLLLTSVIVNREWKRGYIHPDLSFFPSDFC